LISKRKTLFCSLIFKEQITQSSKTKKKKIKKKLTIKSETIEPVEDVKLMLYQWSIAVDSMAQTTRVIFKSLDQLYCVGLSE